MTGSTHVVNAAPEHFKMLKMRPIDASRAALASTTPFEEFCSFIQRGPAVSILHRGISGVEVVATGGLNLSQGNRVGTAWMITSDLVPRFPIVTLRMCRNMVKHGHDVLGLRRIQALTLEGYVKAHSFALSIGLEFEGVLRGFAPDGANMCIFSSVRW